MHENMSVHGYSVPLANWDVSTILVDNAATNLSGLLKT